MIGNSWDVLLKEEYKKDYFINLMDFVKKEYKEKLFIQNKMKYLTLFATLIFQM